MFGLIDASALNNKNRLFCDYLSGASRLADFYPSPFSEKRFRRAQPAIPRDDLAEILSDYNRTIGASPKTLDNIDALRDGDAFAVVSGQQPGFLGGPMYTIYKALSAIALSEEGGFVPVFWNASEDSDFEEVRRTAFFSGEGVTDLASSAEGGGRPVSDIPLDLADVESSLSLFSSHAPHTEFSDHLLGHVRSAATLSRDFAEFFSRLMAWLFGECGLILVEPRILREASVPLLERILRDPRGVQRAFEEKTRMLESLGYEPQVRKKENATNLFLIDGRREPIVMEGEGLRAGERAFSREEMADMLRRSPASFSTSVVLRPVIQDFLLPTAAYIAGPAEIAYFAQLGSVYRHLGVIQPLVYPRHSATVIETKVKKAIDKYDLDFLALKNPQEIIDARARQSADSSFSSYFEEADSLFSRMKKETPPSLGKGVEATRAAVRNELLSLQKKVQAELKREDEVASSQIKKASTMVFPRGEMQERVIGVLEYYNKYGGGILTDLLDAFRKTTPDLHVMLYR